MDDQETTGFTGAAFTLFFSFQVRFMVIFHKLFLCITTGTDTANELQCPDIIPCKVDSGRLKKPERALAG